MEEIFAALRPAASNFSHSFNNRSLQANSDRLKNFLLRLKFPTNKTVEEIECQPVCEDIRLFHEMWLYAYPPLLGLCLLGNVLNLLVYADPHMRATSTVRLLTAKAVANVLYLLSVGLGFVKTAWSESPVANQLYWEAQPTSLFLANTFGGCATWITTALTVETFVCIAFPLKFKEIWTLRLASWLIPLILSLSICLHICTPLTRVTSLIDCRNSSEFRILTKNSNAVRIYEVSYLWTNALLVILLPFVVMSVLSAAILRNLLGSNRSRFSSLRKCIIRITLLTAISHLLLECPQLLLLCAAALRGNSNVNKQPDIFKLDCELNLITNFVSLVNAVLPFFLYVSSSSRFLRVLLSQLGLRSDSVPLNDNFESTTYQARLLNNRKDPAANRSLVISDRKGESRQMIVCGSQLDIRRKLESTIL